eukprot:2828868-Rhodomonas_salina.2
MCCPPPKLTRGCGANRAGGRRRKRARAPSCSGLAPERTRRTSCAVSGVDFALVLSPNHLLDHLRKEPSAMSLCAPYEIAGTDRALLCYTPCVCSISGSDVGAAVTCTSCTVDGADWRVQADCKRANAQKHR